jgi:transcriptional repressor NF-X1
MKETGVETPAIGCLKPCGKIKKACHHPCKGICRHEGKCDQNPCDYKIKVVCDCGNRTAYVDCGCTEEKVFKKIECDDKCKNLKRFFTLYAQSSKVKEYYPRALVKFARLHGAFLKTQEGYLKDFLVNNELAYKISILKKNPDIKKNMLDLLSKHYNLDVFYFKSSTHFIITCSKNELSKPPQMKLSEYYQKILS